MILLNLISVNILSRHHSIVNHEESNRHNGTVKFNFCQYFVMTSFNSESIARKVIATMGTGKFNFCQYFVMTSFNSESIARKVIATMGTGKFYFCQCFVMTSFNSESRGNIIVLRGQTLDGKSGPTEMVL